MSDSQDFEPMTPSPSNAPPCGIHAERLRGFEKRVESIEEDKSKIEERVSILEKAHAELKGSLRTNALWITLAVPVLTALLVLGLSRLVASQPASVHVPSPVPSVQAAPAPANAVGHR